MTYHPGLPGTEVFQDMGHFMLKLWKFQVDQGELVAPKLTKPSQVFQTTVQGEMVILNLTSARATHLSKASGIHWTRDPWLICSTPNLNQKRKRPISLQHRTILNTLHLKQRQSTLAIHENHPRSLKKQTNKLLMLASYYQKFWALVSIYKFFRWF